MVSNFSPDTEVRQPYEAVNEHLGGAGQLYVVLEAADRNAWLEPEALAEVERVQAWLEAQPGVGGTASLVDHVKLLNRGFHEDDPAYHRIPERKRLVSQLLVFGANDEIDHYVDSQRRITTILTRTTALDSSDVAALVHPIEARLAELPEGIDGRVTGNTALIARSIDDIAYSQATSLSTAFVIIYAILALLFVSLHIGFFAPLPNALPVLLYFGARGWTGVTLNTTTGLVACLVLGIAVDDTIHFLARFNAEAKERASVEGGVVGALAHVGRPMTFTSIALCLGFSLLGLSTLKNQAEFGLLAAFTLAFAWLLDVTFTPAMASRLRVVTLWDVLGLDLGEAPQKAIPLFHGLSRTQARIAALMTDLLRFRARHRLIRAGEKSNGTYVAVDGELRSSVEQDGRTIELNRHGRGDVLLEVGLFRGERSANVDCQTDVRVLYVEPEDMERLERRYPRIDARMLANLSRILADRLVGATRRVR